MFELSIGLGYGSLLHMHQKCECFDGSLVTLLLKQNTTSGPIFVNLP